MITVTISENNKPSNPRAIAFAKALAANKKQMQKEMQAYYEKNKEEIHAKLRAAQ